MLMWGENKKSEKGVLWCYEMWHEKREAK